jgi:hypothetical protein
VNCLDCALDGGSVHAVAIRVDCGTAICPDHAVIHERVLVRTGVLLREEPVVPAARVVHCATCASARSAQGRPAVRVRGPLEQRSRHRASRNHRR